MLRSLKGKNLLNFRKSNGKGDIPIKYILESIFHCFWYWYSKISWWRSQGISIWRRFQNVSIIYQNNSKSIYHYCNLISPNKDITFINESKKKEVDDITKRYIEICVLFDSLFSIFRIPYGRVTIKLLNLYS